MAHTTDNDLRLANLRDLTNVSLQLVQDGHNLAAISAIESAGHIIADTDLGSIIPVIFINVYLTNAREELLANRSTNALELLRSILIDLS